MDCQNSVQRREPGSNLAHWAIRLPRAVLSACPYTLLLRALIRWGGIMLGREASRNEVPDRRLADGVVTGRNIMLIGVFCPFFWLSLLSGAGRDQIRLNAIHSGVVAFLGLVWMAKSMLQIERARRRLRGPSDQ